MIGAEKYKMNRINSRSGFTLMELVTAVSILVVLTGLMVPVFTKYIQKAREQRYITEAVSVCQALQMYLLDLDEAGISLSGWELTELLQDYPVASNKHVLYPYLTQKATNEAYIYWITFKDSRLVDMNYSVKGYGILVKVTGEAKIVGYPR